MTNTKISPDEVIMVSKATLDRLFQAGEKDGIKASSLVSLYTLYNYTCKWQKTNQVWANDTYVAKKLGISVGTARKYRIILQDLGLIEAKSRVKDERGRWTKPYVKVKHVFKKKTVEQLTENQITEDN